MLKGVVLEDTSYRSVSIPKDSIVKVCGQEYSNLYPAHEYNRVIFEEKICFIKKSLIKIQKD